MSNPNARERIEGRNSACHRAELKRTERCAEHEPLIINLGFGVRSAGGNLRWCSGLEPETWNLKPET